MTPRCSFVLASLLAAAAGACAQEKIEPDRRDFTTGTGIVASGRVQLEAGAMWERGDTERQWTIGEATLRIPFGASFELHLGLPAYLVRHSNEQASGFDDVPVEARWRFYRSDAIDVGVQAMAMLPTGSRRVAERNLQPGAVFAATLKLRPETELALNVGGRRASQDGQRFHQVFAAASLRTDLSEKWNLFAEAYAFNRDERGGAPRKYLAAGAAYFIDADTALDARIGTGLHNGSGTDVLASAGISHRF